MIVDAKDFKTMGKKVWYIRLVISV
jgi:hypothetical protein